MRLNQLTKKPTTSDRPNRIVTLVWPALSIDTLSTGGPPRWMALSGMPHSVVATFRISSIAPWRFARATSARVSTRQVFRWSRSSAAEPASTPGGGGPIRAPVSRENDSSRSRFRGSWPIRSTARGPVWAVLKYSGRSIRDASSGGGSSFRASISSRGSPMVQPSQLTRMNSSPWKFCLKNR